MANEIVLYQPNEQMSLEVKLENETVWLNRQQLSILFDRDVKTIGKHINNALKEELYHVVAKSTTTGNDSTSNATVAKFAIVQKEGSREVIRQVEFYSLDVILSVGYRVKSSRGIEFRRWANQVFLCIDEMVYHLGASIKDLGKKWFAFCRMEMPTSELLQKMQ